MSCYHPLVGIFDGEYTENGKKKFKIEGSLDPKYILQQHPGSVVIPCGRCIGCRLDYSRSWADRMMLELETSKKGIFLTLTYSNEHITFCKFDDDGLPLAGTLVKRDLQLFLKRLRKHFSELRIKFYASGEYGDRTFRPHYHLILFGIGLCDLHDLRRHGVNEIGQAYYISDTISRIWNNGFCLVSDVSWKTCAYVARYVTKKIGSHVLTRDYLNQLPEFSLMSRKPGLGREYLDLHPDCLDYQNINLSTSEGGLKIRIPKYYLRQLELTDPDRYAILMKERRECASDSMLLQLGKTNLEYLDYLEAKENRKLESLKGLRRCSEMSFNL